MVTQRSDKRLRVFISYSRKDSEFAFRLRAGLEAGGFKTWMDPNLGSEGGQNWRRMIQEAIDSCQAMVVIVSPDSAASEWVEIEYTYIRNQPGKLLIPVYYHTVSPFPMVLDVKERIDFREDQGGKASYQDSLSKLSLSIRKAPMPPNLPPIPQAPAPGPTVNTTSPRGDKPVYPNVAPTPEFSAEIQAWIAGVFKARGEGKLADEEYFLRKLVESGNPQVRDAYQQRLQMVSDQIKRQHIDDLRKQAQGAVTAKQWRVALGAWQAILALAPSNSPAKAGVRQARTEFAKAAFDAGEFDDSVGAWQALMKEDSRSKEARAGLRTALFARADNAWRKGDWTRAAESWEAIRKLPRTYEYGGSNSDQQREGEANKYIDEIKKNQGAAHRYQTAQRLLVAGDTAGALAALKDLYKVAPNYGDPAGIASQVTIDVPKTLVDRWIETERQRKANEQALTDRRKANEQARKAQDQAYEIKRKEQKRIDSWLTPSSIVAFIYCPVNYLAATITSAIRAGDWWTGTMLANSIKLAWVSLLLSVGLLILCEIIVVFIRSAINARSFGLQLSIALLFSLLLAVPGCWLVALWLYTGYQKNMDLVTLGIIIGASTGGIITAFLAGAFDL